jgi:hypothetical protein
MAVRSSEENCLLRKAAEMRQTTLRAFLVLPIRPADPTEHFLKIGYHSRKCLAENTLSKAIVLSDKLTKNSYNLCMGAESCVCLHQKERSITMR